MSLPNGPDARPTVGTSHTHTRTPCTTYIYTNQIYHVLIPHRSRLSADFVRHRDGGDGSQGIADGEWVVREQILWNDYTPLVNHNLLKDGDAPLRSILRRTLARSVVTIASRFRSTGAYSVSSSLSVEEAVFFLEPPAFPSVNCGINAQSTPISTCTISWCLVLVCPTHTIFLHIHPAMHSAFRHNPALIFHRNMGLGGSGRYSLTIACACWLCLKRWSRSCSPTITTTISTSLHARLANVL